MLSSLMLIILFRSAYERMTLALLAFGLGGFALPSPPTPGTHHAMRGNALGLFQL